MKKSSLKGCAVPFPENLRVLREARGLTQAKLAKRSRLSIAYISLLERGHRCPPLPTLDALGRGLGVSPLSLLEPRPAAKAA
jgi:transcriptional regulator with XRE-family HTH domain